MLNMFRSVVASQNWSAQARRFSRVAAYAGQEYVKSIGLQYHQISQTNPSSPLPGIQGILRPFLPARREDVTRLAEDREAQKNILSILADNGRWINSDENKYGVLIANAPTSPSEHRYLLVTPQYSLSEDGFAKWTGLTDTQLMLQLASCVPNGAKIYGNIPVETAVLPGAPSLTIDKVWPEKTLESIIQLGSYNFIKAKLYPRLELNDHIVIPLDAQTLDPYHTFSGGLGWFLVIDKKSKALRGFFPGAGRSPWSLLDIANNHLGAGYWTLNVACLAAVLSTGSKLPLVTPDAITKAANGWLVGNKLRSYRRTLEVFDKFGSLIAVNPEAVGWNPIYGEVEPGSSDVATIARQVLKDADSIAPLQAISGMPILRSTPEAEITRRPGSFSKASRVQKPGPSPTGENLAEGGMGEQEPGSEAQKIFTKRKRPPSLPKLKEDL